MAKEAYSGKFPSLTAKVKINKTAQAMTEWAHKMAKGHKYKYKRWSSHPNTHKCPICHPGTGNGWNCIGWAYAIWHHGGKLKSKCNCGVINNAKYEQILNAKNSAEATKIAKKAIGINDIKVIRNGRKAIPKDKFKAGDICVKFVGNRYQHTYYYEGNNKYSDSTSGRKDNIKAGNKLSSSLRSQTKLLIRYTNPKIETIKKTKSIRKGDKRTTQVKRWQRWLNWYLDGKLAVDGVFGTKTETATIKAQKKLKVKKDGIVGTKTLAAAKAAVK